MNRSKKEWLKDQVDKLEVNEHIQIYSIIKKYTEVITKSPTGIFVSSENLSDECLLEMEKYVLFCLDQRKRMEDDMKTRKSYERMIE
jgi:hypothetical protein